MKDGLELCPNCLSGNLKKVRCCSRILPWWHYIECFDCHWCGKTRLFLRRAIKIWNKDARKLREKKYR